MVYALGRWQHLLKSRQSKEGPLPCNEYSLSAPEDCEWEKDIDLLGATALHEQGTSRLK